MTVKYVFDPEVTEDEWLDIEEGIPWSDAWAVWRSMPYPEGRQEVDRKRLLLVAHLVRQVADQMSDPRFVAVIAAAEKGADGLISREEMWAAREAAYELFDTVPQPHEAAEDAADVSQRFIYDQNETAEMVFRAAGSRAAHLAGGKGKKAETARREAEEAIQALMRRLINEVHGNPFRPVAFEPSWRTPTVVALAQAAYEERLLPSGELDSIRLAILADGLEDAGCTDAGILSHLRSAALHIRGCWAVDAIIGKS